MKKTLIIIGAFCCFQLFAQDETLLIESNASLVLSGGVKLVLADISLTNEGNLDLSSEELILDASSDCTVITNSSLEIATLTTKGNGGSFTFGGAYDVTDFTLGGPDQMSFSDTSSLTLSGIINNAGDLTMKSGSSLFIKTSSSGVSSVFIERTTTFDENTGKYSVVSSPIEDASFSDLGTNAQNWIFEYNEDVAYGSDGSARFDSPSESTMTKGKGYFSAFTGDADGTITFEGVPNYTNVNYAITYTNHAGDAADVEGFNLIGNPFTCPIDFETFISNANNSSLLDEQTIWIWDDIASDAGGGSNLDYVSVNVVGSSSVDSQNGGYSNWDGTINVGQGFFVKASTSGNIRFNQGMKTMDGNDDASFFRTEEIAKYWLGISNESNEFGSSTLIGFASEATEGIDSYDATRFGQGFAVYTVVEGKKLAIQGLSNDWLNGLSGNDQIALGYNVKEAGTFQISLRGMENASSSTLYLIDHALKESINILMGTYTFQSEAGSFNDRFTISTSPFSAEEVLATSSELNIKVSGNANGVSIQSQIDGEYKIWTMSGTMLSEGKLNKGKTQIDVYQNNIYVVAIENGEGVSTYKVKAGF